MTTFISSAARKKNINPGILIMRVRTFQQQSCGVRRCVAHGLYRSRFHSIRRKVRLCDKVLGKD